MARPSKRQTLDLWANGMLVGHWSISGQGVHSLAYANEWRHSPYGRPISLSLPIEDDHRGPVVEAYFDNLLPDNAAIRTRLQQKFSAASDHAFDLLTELGRDCVGALQLMPAGEDPPAVKDITGVPLSDPQIEHLLDNVIVSGRHTEDDDFRISVAGAQEKTALLWRDGGWWKPTGATPTTHLLKLPIGKHSDLQLDLSTSVDNEWICSRVLHAYGMSVADARPAAFGHHRVLVVTRFDRQIDASNRWYIRIPQEDLCQAFGLPSSAKYEENGGPGILKSMQLLLGSGNFDTDRRSFFRAQILFWLLAAIDGHAKNFSIQIAAQGRFTLQPIYDVLSAHPYLRQGQQTGIGKSSLEAKKIRMAMAWSGANRHYRWAEIEPRHFIETGRRCGLSPSIVHTMLAEIVAQTPHVCDTVAAECEDADTAVRNRILDGVTQAAEKIARAIIN